MYLLVFLTGDKKAEPKLGIDLQGGTRVTLTARTPDGSRPTQDALNQAQQIIASRVNGLGVSGSEVVIDGDNLVITVPGNDSNEARNLGQTARLYIRPVIHVDRRPASAAARRAGRPGPGRAAGRPAGSHPKASPHRRRRRRWHPQSRAAFLARPQSRPRPNRRWLRSRVRIRRLRRPARRHRVPRRSLKRRTLLSASPTRRRLRQSTEQQIQILALQFQATRCNEDDVLAGNDDPNLPLVTCSTDHSQVYLLDKSIISGEQIKNASSGMDTQRGEYIVQVEFKPDAATTWADFTASHVGTQTAFTLDSQVVSAPQIEEAIPGGNTQITGQFNAEKAKELANVLKYGSLPLSFESSEAETVSATLGLTSLRAGLIAGAIGLALVLLIRCCTTGCSDC